MDTVAITILCPIECGSWTLHIYANSKNWVVLERKLILRAARPLGVAPLLGGLKLIFALYGPLLGPGHAGAQ